MELRKEPSTEPEAPPDQLGDLLTLLRNIKEKQKTNSRALLEKQTELDAAEKEHHEAQEEQKTAY